MVLNEVILDTVKRMVSSGVDDETIRITLKSIELSDAEIDEIIAEVRGTKAKPVVSKNQSPSEQVSSKQYVSEEKEGDTQEDEENLPEEPEEPIIEGDNEVTAEDVSEIRKQIHASSGEQIAMHTTTHQMLDEHYGKLSEVHDSINELHQKVDSSPQISPETVAKISALDLRISGLEKEISEVKANTIALQGLLQKILEANREIISELEKKK
jgi:ribosomal protein L12E/L44/L45/RPP1/RPP2